MGRALTAAGTLVAWLCIGMVLGQAVILGYLHSKGVLDGEKLADIAALLQGIDLTARQARPVDVEEEQGSPQVSLDDVARARALKSRDLELREQAMRNHLERAKYEQAKLNDENDRFN